MSHDNDDGVDREFEDWTPEDWEELFSRPEDDRGDRLWHSRMWHSDDPFEPTDQPEEPDNEPVFGLPDTGHVGNPPHRSGGSAGAFGDKISVPLTPAMIVEATQFASEMDAIYADTNSFGPGPTWQKQRIGVLGSMAYAQAAFGQWQRHRDNRQGLADFGLLDVKSSRLHYHRRLSRLNLIEAESFLGHEPPQYSLYVQVFVDVQARLAVLAGWCTGLELWQSGKVPIPNGGGRRGYQRPVALLHPMRRLPQAWRSRDDGRAATFYPHALEE